MERADLRSGHAEAFAELFDTYASSVFWHALRLVHDRAAAEDVMSETFLVAWRTRATITAEGGSLRPWLLGIATRQALNARRGRRRRLALLDRVPEETMVSDFAEETAARLDDAHQLELTRRALRHLRTHELEVLSLCVWSHLSYEEAAAALKVSVGTVRSRLSRARRRLRELTAELGEETRATQDRMSSHTTAGEGAR